jgi:hypothetical protein
MRIAAAILILEHVSPKLLKASFLNCRPEQARHNFALGTCSENAGKSKVPFAL